MKKTGFTLAEILITLAIVGIVAALAIPSLVTKASRQAMVSKLSSIVTDLENAFGNMITDKDADGLFDDDVFTIDNMRKHLTITQTGETPSDVGYTSNSPFFKLDGTAAGDSFTTNGKNYDCIVLKNNAIITYDVNTDTCSGADICATESGGKDIIIDVNGLEGPNRWGRDVFCFAAGSTGSLYPQGGVDYSDITGSHGAVITECPTSPWSCAYRVVKNNYKVDY